MKILRSLNKKNFFILFFLFFVPITSAEEKPVDIWNIDKKEIKTGSIDQMSREETEAKLKEIMQQFSIDGDYEDLLEIENKS